MPTGVELTFSIGEVFQIIGGAIVLWQAYSKIMAKINENHLTVIKQVGEITKEATKQVVDLDKELVQKLTDSEKTIFLETDAKIERLRIEVTEVRDRVTRLEPLEG
jgi:hypothetical protein